jgi:hypothetical protein
MIYLTHASAILFGVLVGAYFALGRARPFVAFGRIVSHKILARVRTGGKEYLVLEEDFFTDPHGSTPKVRLFRAPKASGKMHVDGNILSVR